MNRDQRRRANRELTRARRRARVESMGITASCAWPSCRQLLVVGAPSMEAASAVVHRHLEEKHAGRGPQPVEGNCMRCKQLTHVVPCEPMLCVSCKELEPYS